LSALQLTEGSIADMATEIDASALLVYRSAWAKDCYQDRVTREAAMAKLYATEAAQRTIDRAVQLFGGRGVVKGNIAERLYREIRALRIYEGASEVQKVIIARQLPEGWPRPRGYSNGIQADGEQVFVAGMIGWNEREEMADGFVAQLELALRNTVAVLAEAGAGPEHITRMTWYVKGLDEYRQNIKGVGQAYREVIGKNFPAMAVIGIVDLVDQGALVEIETTAVIPR
jgi:enamine deaminase RidA (YjgF/YER057c/UK114 family)